MTPGRGTPTTSETGLIAPRHDRSPLADAEALAARVRWLAVLALPVLVVLHRPPAGATLHLPAVAFVLAVAPFLLVANLLALRAVREPDADRLARISATTLGLDVAVALAAIAQFGAGLDTPVWPLLVVVILEGAVKWRLRGALVVWAVVTGGWILEQAVRGPLGGADGGGADGGGAPEVAVAGTSLLLVAVAVGVLAQRAQDHRTRLAEQNRELLGLAVTARSMTSQREPARVFDRVVRTFRDVTGADVVAFYERTDDARWVRRASLGATAGEVGEVERVPVFDRLAEEASGPVALRPEGDLAERVERVARGCRAVVAVPVSDADQVVGLVMIGSHRDEITLGDADRALLELLAAQAAVAIDTADVLEAEARTIAELRAVDELKDDFVAILSHELRSPLTTVGGFAQLLRDRWDQLAETDRRSYLDRIARTSDRLAQLVQDVLDASEAERSQLPLAPRPVDVELLAREVAEEEVGRSPAHHLTIRVAPPIPSVVADPDRLRQVLHNLLSNAVKYSPDGGRVTVDIRREGGTVAIGVADDGVGIPADDLDGLFRKFGRLRSTHQVRGTGLGLYLSRMLIEAMGGTIAVTSSIGSGSEFTVRLPITSEGHRVDDTVDRIVLPDADEGAGR